MKSTYAAAGVDTDSSARIKKIIANLAKTASRPEVLSGVGFFGGMFELKGYRRPVLVSSVDGVGTKLKIAAGLNKHDTVGIDIVNHSVNDIFTGGADPLFFLDYIAMGKLVPETVAAIVSGLAKACKDAGCALIGGETAEMPGVYRGNDYDLVGMIVGAVEKDKITMGRKIIAGDAIIGLPSSGLHTNGYSLVRKVFGETKKSLTKYYPELGRTLGEALLEPHRCYYNQLKPHISLVKGMAHITGGGLIGNVPRALPAGLMAKFDTKKWEVLPIFELIRKTGEVECGEMFQVFNMGIGMAVICAPEKVNSLLKKVPGAKLVGEVAKQTGEVRVMIDRKGYKKDKVA
ncbi:MAG: phosphoribosylformylglycinamidine cyclo-ligase [Dehalococcoidales bacterium]|nr:phosphoribosylformylglycinamidine cyclo-ligase [Dehalococcoidales bacterium]